MTSTRSVIHRPLAVLSGRYAPLWPAIRWILGAVGIIYCLLVVLDIAPYSLLPAGPGGEMADAYAYWSAPLDDPYAGSVLAGRNAYLYSPAFLHAFAPLQMLPWTVFAVGWFALHLFVLWRLGALWMLALPFVSDDVIRGNIHTFYAAALVWPALLPLLPLTKVTPGVGWLGMSWQTVLRAALVTVGIVAVSYLLAPHLWADWVDVLVRSSRVDPGIQVIRVPLLYRLPVALSLAVASHRWRWLLPIAVLLASPNIWPSSFALLAAIPRLTRRSEA